MKFTDENRQKQEVLNKKLVEKMKAEFHNPTKRGTGRGFHLKQRNSKGLFLIFFMSTKESISVSGFKMLCFCRW